MIKITFGLVRDRQVQQALTKLSNYEGFGTKDAYHFGRIYDKFLSYYKESNVELAKMREKFKKEYATLNDDGTVFEPIDEKTGKALGEGSFQVRPECEELVNKEQAAFDDIELTIEKHKIKLSSLEKAALTPVDLFALEPFFVDDLDEEKTELKSV